MATNQFPYDGKGVRIEPFPRQSDVDALRTRVTDLELILVDLIDRIDRNGGLGEYKGGSAFVLKRARELLLGATPSP